MNFSVWILVIAIVLFGVLAFRQMSALILAPAVTIFVIVLSGLPVLDTLLGSFMPATSDYITKYFLIFFVGALFGAVYQFTGAAESIALTIGKLSGNHFVAPVIMCITGLLTFGGVSGFVVFFVVYPIALQMFKRADITRRLIPAAISSGCWSWSMTAPGSPSIQNTIAMRSLGTPATVAFVPSLIATVAEFLMIFIWLEWRARKFSAVGKCFHDDTLKMQLSAEELSERPSENLPHPLIAFIPIVSIIFCFNILKLPVETSVTFGIIAAVILMFKKVANISSWIEVFNKGAADSGSAILNTAIVVGFGGVVEQTDGFHYLISHLQDLSIPPLVFVAITIAICAGVCGSASGGMGIAFAALTDTYKSMGVSLEAIHRIGAIAAGTLDTLPHQGAQITLLGICKLTHKEAYFDIAITQILIPILTLFIFIPLVSVGL